LSSVHIGHHFFGAGNAGDDWMMAGFLSAVPVGSAQRVGDNALHHRFTCCVPYPLAPLQARFPQVDWLPYDEPTRRAAIERCDVWLGLGGSPFQSAVSRWFVDHLAAEAEFCREAEKPMFFLGIGGQDPATYALPEMTAVLHQAKHLWTRDERTAQAAKTAGAGSRISVGADLAHLHFRRTAIPAAQTGRFSTVLNFEYAAMPVWLPSALTVAGQLAAAEKIWAVQEERPLPGAERWLFDQLNPTQRQGWNLRQETLEQWPSGQWLLSSRYHSTLAGAWAGSRAVIIGLNEKLRAAADETGFPVFGLEDDPGHLKELFEGSRVVPRARLEARADLAAKCCTEFFRMVGD
jgi:hypothetical protein